jgi:hypothetical protein
MKPQLISPVMAGFFALLAAIFLVLSTARGAPPAKKTWRRIGIIFALVALVIFVVRPK